MKILKEKTVDWQPLVQRASSLTNDSDRVFVVAYIAQCMHSGLIAEKTALLKEARVVADNIPSIYDRVERLRLLATVAEDLDTVLARSLVVDAMNVVKKEDTRDAEELRRKLVDIAYQIDPDLAVSLASSLDDDKARSAARRRIDYQKLKRDLLDSEHIEDNEIKGQENDYSSAAWELLGYLNSGRAEARDVMRTLKFVRIAANGTLRSAFPILSWVIENAIVKRAHADEARRMVREMFDATMSASEIAAAVVSRAAGRTTTVSSTTIVKDQQRIIVGAEQRVVAIDFIEQWLRNNGNEYLKICDPYFGPKDLDILRMVISAGRQVQVTIVTSMKQQQQEKVEWPADEFYLKYWRKHFSDQPPPTTEIVVVGGRSGELPVHDRWWLTKGAGLRLGSSFGGIGKTRDSEISVLTEPEIEERLQITESYVSRQKREHLGEKLKYQFFEIS
jgi:hypothetical protein